MTLTQSINSPSDPADVVLAPADPIVSSSASRAALAELLGMLAADGYSFVTVTPSTHARVIARPDRQYAASVRDVLGWSLPFEPEALPRRMVDLLDAGGVLTRREDGLFKCRIRVSSVRGTLFLHSAYPTTERDSVFLGPDSYRFADLIVSRMGELPPNAAILDYGAGAGVGGITAGRKANDPLVTLADINPDALGLASLNADFAGLRQNPVSASTPADVGGFFDLVVTHPPFMMDTDHRTYRDGGGLYGAGLSHDWILASLSKLKQGGKLIAHTGVSIVGGADVLLQRLEKDIPSRGFRWDYHELDPDIFGDELDQPPYRNVERIAAVGLCVTRTGEE